MDPNNPKTPVEDEEMPEVAGEDDAPTSSESAEEAEPEGPPEKKSSSKVPMVAPRPTTRRMSFVDNQTPWLTNPMASSSLGPRLPNPTAQGQEPRLLILPALTTPPRTDILSSHGRRSPPPIDFLSCGGTPLMSGILSPSPEPSPLKPEPSANRGNGPGNRLVLRPACPPPPPPPSADSRQVFQCPACYKVTTQGQMEQFQRLRFNLMLQGLQDPQAKRADGKRPPKGDDDAKDPKIPKKGDGNGPDGPKGRSAIGN